MNTKFLATSLDKLSSDIRIQIIIAGLTLVSLVLGILVFLPQIDVQDYLRPIFTFDFIVVIIFVVDFYARMKASKQGFRYLKKTGMKFPR
jgi:hypothetical protein